MIKKGLFILLCGVGLVRAEMGAPDVHRDVLQFMPLRLPTVRAVEDVHALPGHPGLWLIATGDALLLRAGSDLVDLASGRFASLDARLVPGSDTQVLVTAVDVDAASVLVASLRVDEAISFQKHLRLQLAQDVPEAQCLFRDWTDDSLSVFITDARGGVEQRYIHTGADGELLDLPARRFYGVPDAESCAVDDAQALLYLGEQELAVWRYDARVEGEETSREPVILRRPFGGLLGEVSDVAVDRSGALWVLDAQARQLHRQDRAGGVTTLTLAEQAGVERLALEQGAETLRLIGFDVEAGQLLYAESALEPAQAMPVGIPSVTPAAETAPVARYGDAADDPAIFVDPEDAGASLILGTDKREGLAVYDLDGALRQMLSVGRLNNVDLMAGVTLGGRERTIVAASKRDNDSIALFEIVNREVRPLTEIVTGLAEVYGLCTYASDSGAYVFINATDGHYEQYRLGWEDGLPTATRVRRFALPSQPEGCAADALTGVLYLGEEGAGIWRAGAEPDGFVPEFIIPLGDSLVADVEGMDVYRDGERGFLVVSSQGSDSYAVYALREGYPLATAFRIGADLASGHDGVSETDGLAVTHRALPGFPRGLLVVQDGHNRLPDAPQNFKLVDWRRVEALLD